MNKNLYKLTHKSKPTFAELGLRDIETYRKEDLFAMLVHERQVTKNQKENLSHKDWISIKAKRWASVAYLLVAIQAMVIYYFVAKSL